MNTKRTFRSDRQPPLLLKKPLTPDSITALHHTQLTRIIEVALYVSAEGAEQMIAIGEQAIRRSAESPPHRPKLYLIDSD